jgi:hypothetical protein
MILLLTANESFRRLLSLLAMSRSLFALLRAARTVIICLRVGAGLALRADRLDRLLDAMTSL